MNKKELILEEVFWKVSRLIKFPEFEKKNKIFLLIATLLKAVIVLSISILAYKVKDEPDELAACVATCPIIFMVSISVFTFRNPTPEILKIKGQFQLFPWIPLYSLFNDSIRDPIRLQIFYKHFLT